MLSLLSPRSASALRVPQPWMVAAVKRSASTTINTRCDPEAAKNPRMSARALPRRTLEEREILARFAGLAENDARESALAALDVRIVEHEKIILSLQEERSNLIRGTK